MTTIKRIGVVIVLLNVFIKIDAQEFPRTVWYPSRIMNAWAGKNSIVGVMTNDFLGVVNGLALRPKNDWRPQMKQVDIDYPDHLPQVHTPDVRVVEIDGDYRDDYEDVDYPSQSRNKERNLDDELEQFMY